MDILRKRELGFLPTHTEINRAIFPYVLRQFCYHWSYQLGLLRH
jgi:hypothetical protein